jgi:hypothetical protein
MYCHVKQRLFPETALINCVYSEIGKEFLNSVQVNLKPEPAVTFFCCRMVVTAVTETPAQERLRPRVATGE